MELKDWTVVPIMAAAVVWLAERVKELIAQKSGRARDGLSRSDADRILRWVEQAPQAVATITGTLNAIAEMQRELVHIHADQTEILNRLTTEVAVMKVMVDRRQP